MECHVILHIYIYIYIYMCVCVCEGLILFQLSVYLGSKARFLNLMDLAYFGVLIYTYLFVWLF